MTATHHVIIGTGPAGVTAAETIRQHDPSARITMIGGEGEAPYSRMAIPYLLEGKVGEQGTYLRQQPNHYADLDINLLDGPVTRVDTKARTVTHGDGQTVAFDKLLIATGAHPVRPPISGLDQPGVHTCWTLDDARHIVERALKDTPVVLVGAGFIGSIILEALAKAGVRLTVVEMGDRMVPRMLDETAGNMLREWCEQQGVRVITGTTVDAINAHPATSSDARDAAAPATNKPKGATTDTTTGTMATDSPSATPSGGVAPSVTGLFGVRSALPSPSSYPAARTAGASEHGAAATGNRSHEHQDTVAASNDNAPVEPGAAVGARATLRASGDGYSGDQARFDVVLGNGETIPAALVVIAAGVRPNVDFLDGSGIAIQNGVTVDDHLATSITDVYAAGDVAEGRDLTTGAHEMLAIQPVAVEHGYIAGLNMAGVPTRHRGSLNMNVLDTLGLISSSFGKWDGVEGGDRAIMVDAPNWRYLRLEFDGDKLIGAQAVGRTDQIGMVRGLIQTGLDLGPWKQRLMDSPERLAEAYVANVQSIPDHGPGGTRVALPVSARP